jgi:hypothetical protein
MFDNLDGPIMNVLRKSFQTTHKQIEAKVQQNIKVVKEDIQKHLKLGDQPNYITPYLGTHHCRKLKRNFAHWCSIATSATHRCNWISAV